MATENSAGRSYAQRGDATLRRTFKDSVFTDLFSDPRYVYELYRGLHPDDEAVGLDDIQIVTIQNVLTMGSHNDLGFIAGDRLLVLVEAQSTWSPNIALRALLYAAQTIKDIVRERKLDVYGSLPVVVPRPELYVIYTGDRSTVPDVITLSEALFAGLPSGVESTVHVLCDVDSSVSGQYIDFAHTMDAWRRELGPTEHAIRAAIAECLHRGVLVDYLAARGTEVADIMITLYDEEEVLRIHIDAQVREGVQRGLEEGLEQGIERGIQQGIERGIERGIEQGVKQGLIEGEYRGIVETCRELGVSRSDTVARVAAKLCLDLSDAEAVVDSLW